MIFLWRVAWGGSCVALLGLLPSPREGSSPPLVDAKMAPLLNQKAAPSFERKVDPLFEKKWHHFLKKSGPTFETTLAPLFDPSLTLLLEQCNGPGPICLASSLDGAMAPILWCGFCFKGGAGSARNMVPLCDQNVGPLCDQNVGPLFVSNVGPRRCSSMASPG